MEKTTVSRKPKKMKKVNNKFMVEMFIFKHCILIRVIRFVRLVKSIRITCKEPEQAENYYSANGFC